MILLSWGFAEITARSETVIHVGVEPGLKFDVSRFTVPPGGDVRLVFTNTDTDMPHNLLITMPGSRIEVVMAAMQLGAEGPERQYVPDSNLVLHYTRVLQAGESETLTFTAPEEEGVYPYVCTFPGHGFVMFGDMYVREDSGRPPEEESLSEVTPDLTEGHVHEGPAIEDEYEPRILRTFLRDTGPASIAVRLPGGHAYAWDAGGARLRFLWKGGFVDNLAQWRGNGSSFGEIVGRIYYRAPTGEDKRRSPVQSEFGPHPLRIGDEASPAAVVRFRGYRIIEGLPEFHYEIEGREVREFIYPNRERDGIVRRFQIETGGNDGPVFFHAETNAGVRFTSSAGDWSGDILTLAADEARDFTLTMREIPGHEPIGYWSMNDEVWNPGFMQSSAINDGVRGRAVRFNNNQVNTGIQSDEIRHHGTFAAWVRPVDVDATGQFFFQGSSGPGEFFGVGYNLGIEGIGVLNRGGGKNEELHSRLPLSSQWQHVAVTVSPNGITLYVNGESTGSRSTGGILMDNAALFIGSLDEEAFRGDLDEVRVYQRALSAEEIHALYVAEKPEEETDS